MSALHRSLGSPRRITRRAWLRWTTTVFLSSLGCSSPLLRKRDREKDLTAVDIPNPKLVREMTRVWGMRPLTVEGIGLVTNLDNTGSDPPASPQRDVLIGEMQKRGVESPGKVLNSRSSSLVLVRAVMPPGVQKGDRIDIEVMTPTRSETESLRGGWLLQTRLQELAVLGNQIRSGREVAQAEGALLIDSLLESDQNARSETRGTILGGGYSRMARTLGLVLSTEHHSVAASAAIGAAVNRRFHMQDRGNKRGVATPKRDNFIELAVHPRYRRNLVRYVRVIQAVPLKDQVKERSERLTQLELELLDPATAMTAAVDLEAMGTDATPALKKGLGSASPLVRFASAEALAYMNNIEAVPHLVEAAKKELAFRWHALTALSAMSESEAREGLSELLHTDSDETRYGAFQALMDFNPHDPLVQGRVLGDALTMHEIPSDVTPLVHIRKSERPEIVLFGKGIRFQEPVAVFAGKNFLIKSDGAGHLKVTRFAVARENTSETCEADVASMIRTLVQMGGSYADVVTAIHHAKQKGQLEARVKFDALPKAGRQYHLADEDQSAPTDDRLQWEEEGLDADAIEAHEATRKRAGRGEEPASDGEASNS